MYFCLHCFSGKETGAKGIIEKILNEKTDFESEVWIPMKEYKLKRNGCFIKKVKPMFDGYLFILWNGENEKEFPFNEIVSIPGVIRFLSYDNGQRELMGKDLSFVSWIHDNNGVIRESKIMLTEGKKVHFVEGPLVGFDGNVVKIDKHHKKVTVLFEIEGKQTQINFSADFIQRNVTIENLTN